MKGYLVSSSNGRGKRYFFLALEDAQKELKKHSLGWGIYRVIKTGQESYQLIAREE